MKRAALSANHVIPGRHRQAANPKSMALGRWLRIPGSRAKARALE
jgi:hypothetical protein